MNPFHPWRQRWTAWWEAFLRAVRVGRHEVYVTASEGVRSSEALGGALAFLGLYLLSFLQAFGVRSMDRPEQIWLLRLAPRPFLLESLWGVALCGGHLLLGALWGWSVGQAWSLTARITPHMEPRHFKPWVRGQVAAGLTLAAHGTLLFQHMAGHPAAYAPYFQGFLWERIPAVACAFQSSLYGFLAGAAVVTLLLAMGGEILWKTTDFLLRLSSPVRMAGITALSAVFLFTAGLWGVYRAALPDNTGPNVVLLVLEGLRRDALLEDPPFQAPTLRQLARQSLLYTRCVAPLSVTRSCLATLQTGLSPLLHGVRSAWDTPRNIHPTLADLCRSQGVSLGVVADDSGARWADWGPFDFSRLPEDHRSALSRRRLLERRYHLLPYLSQGFLRRWTALDTAPSLADPLLLAAEAGQGLNYFQHRKQFFLTLHSAALTFPLPLGSPNALRAWSAAGRKLEGPWQMKGQPASTQEAAEARLLYAANLAALDDTTRAVMAELRRLKLDDTTSLVIWSPYAEALGESGFWGHGHQLAGRAVTDSPLLITEPLFRRSPHQVDIPVPAQDVGPTVLTLLGLPVPEEMDGEPLTRLTTGERIVYAETDLWTSPQFPAAVPEERLPYPWGDGLLEPRPEDPGRLRVKPRWIDHVLVAKERMVQRGPFRLIYRPTPQTILWTLREETHDPDGALRPEVNRATRDLWATMKNAFYLALSPERGWQPQNDYWIPEAFLRESTGQ